MLSLATHPISFEIPCYPILCGPSHAVWILPPKILVSTTPPVPYFQPHPGIKQGKSSDLAQKTTHAVKEYCFIFFCLPTFCYF
jgi:hypothetical protein